MSKIPIVNFSLLDEEFYITDFIQVRNPQLLRIASRIKAESVDEAIKKVARYVARRVTYPLDYKGRPTAAHYAKLFKFRNGLYLEDKAKNYAWLLPNQCDRVEYGICMDSACLTTSLLRILGVRAWTALGAVLRTRSRRLLGFHAWTEAVNGKAKHVVLETTVHPKPADPVPAEKIYGGKLPITYDVIARFNELGWWEDAEKAKQYEEALFGDE